MRFTPGTFNYVDLVARDIARIRPFYEALFGWSYAEQTSHGGPPYGMFARDGKTAAGVGQMSAEMIEAGTPSTWNTYVTVDDLAATEAKVRELGGTLLFETITIPGAGKTNWVRDPEGAVLALWEPMGHAGSDVVNVPGSFCWNERATRDLAGFEAFYGALFGWRFVNDDNPHGTVRMIHNAAGREQGHALVMTEAWGDFPPSWAVYFAVEDCNAAVERAVDLGGQVNVPRIDIAVGRFSNLSDPDRASFYVIQLNDVAT